MALGSCSTVNYVEQVVFMVVTVKFVWNPHTWRHWVVLSCINLLLLVMLYKICKMVSWYCFFVVVFFSQGMVSISSLQTPEEKAESAGRDEFFWHCCKCFGPKQKRPHTGTGRIVPLSPPPPTPLGPCTIHVVGGSANNYCFDKCHEWKCFNC